MHEAKFWQEKLEPYTHKSNAIGTWQVLVTLVPFVALWTAYAYCVQISRWFALPFCVLIFLFLIRLFVLMHDCGHNSLFASRRANRLIGFLLGVLTGMPQFVWSKNHAYHHNTNGDWVKYGGVFNILSTERYTQLSEKHKRRYWRFRQPLILIPAGFFYVVFNPRINWLLGNLVMLRKISRALLTLQFRQAVAVASAWECKYWKGKKDYLHMTYNNLALLSLWFVMCRLIDPADFFLLYLSSTSLAGSAGILVFTIQHNFEDSYATDSARVDYFRAALEGTSMLILPRVLNWFTADIAYHHLHHLSVAIPNYRLAASHFALEPLFAKVKRVYLSEVLDTFEYQLWDSDTQKVVARDTLGASNSLG